MNLYINPNVAQKTFSISKDIFEFTTKHFGKNQEMKAWVDFLNSDPDDYPMNQDWMNVFVIWYLYSWNRENIERPAIEYMIEHYSKLSEIERKFIGSCVSNIFSFYTIETVEPGRCMEIKDLFSKAKFLVFETHATRKLYPGMIIFTRVACVENLSFLVCGTIPIPKAFLGEIKKLARDKKWKNDELSRIALYFNIGADIIISREAAE